MRKYKLKIKDIEPTTSIYIFTIFFISFVLSFMLSALLYDKNDGGTKFGIEVFAGVSLLMLSVFYFVTMKKMNRLQNYGTLYRNIPFNIISTNTRVNSFRGYKILVTLDTGEGHIYNLESNEKFDGLQREPHFGADVIIDLDNPKNYYVGFDIKEV